MAVDKNKKEIDYNCKGNSPLYTYAWTFSGCDVEPTSASTDLITIKVRKPGVLTVSVVATPVTGGEPFSDQTTVAVIGGPLDFSSDRPNQKREQRMLGAPANLFQQPWILEWFETAPQKRSVLTATMRWAQPPGTTQNWIHAGPLEIVSGQGTPTLKVRANGQSVRGGAGVTLGYSITIGPTTVTTTDTSAEEAHRFGIPDHNVRAISCHRPTEVRKTPEEITSLNHQGPPMWSYGEKHKLQLWSNVGDPFREVWVQERCENDEVPTHFDDGQPMGAGLTWNGTTAFTWTSSGETDILAANEPGYSYHAKFTDTLAFFNWPSPVGRPIAGGLSVLTFQHYYFAGTEVTEWGKPGVSVSGRYTAKMYTDKVTHTQP